MTDSRNKRLMQLVRRVHGLMELDDTKKSRDSQEHLGTLYAADPHYTFVNTELNNLHSEWTHYIKNNTQTSSSVIFYCHGGGYMTGSCMYARSITMKLAKYTGCDVFSFDYRLAPEHPYPAAIEDALTAWDFILSQGLEPDRIIVAGDSAGGNLALALIQSLQLKKMPLPMCLILFSPWTDMTASSQTYLSKLELDPVLNPSYIKKAASCYLQNTPATLPLVSPLFSDLTGFPPVYIQVGENEILLDDSVLLHRHLLECNVYAKLDIFAGMWHVFQMTPIKTAREAILKVNYFLNHLPVKP